MNSTVALTHTLVMVMCHGQCDHAVFHSVPTLTPPCMHLVSLPQCFHDLPPHTHTLIPLLPSLHGIQAPAPCSDYPITGYRVTYRAYSDSDDLSVPQEQRRNIVFLRTQPQIGSDMIELGASDNLIADRLVLVVITATNSAGETESEEISFRKLLVGIYR